MRKNHPFRFGFTTSAPTRKEWIDIAQKAEALGFDSLLVPDHLYNAMAPIAAIMAAADATTTLRVGSFVFGNDFRHPVILAKEAATLDVLTNGRFEFGLGTGYLRGDYDTSGIPFDRPGVRVDRLIEAVHVIKGFFSGEPFSFEGEHYTVCDLVGEPKSLQRPHPPIIIGGGSRRTLSLAAQEADIVSVNIRTTKAGGFDFSSIKAEAANRKIEWVLKAAGSRFDDLIINTTVTLVAVTDNRYDAANGFLQPWHIPEDQLSVDEFLDSPFALIGSVDQIVDTLLERRERYGFSYIVIWPPMEPFIPVIERLAGR